MLEGGRGVWLQVGVVVPAESQIPRVASHVWGWIYTPRISIPLFVSSMFMALIRTKWVSGIIFFQNLSSLMIS